MVRIAFLHTPKGKKSFFGKSNRGAEDESIGNLYFSFKIESELSPSIDYDEIKMGPQLAKGGYGTVYKGTWRDAEVAVKKLNVQDLVDEEKEMVRREIRLMSKLNYSYIVTYMGSTQIPGQPLCIIMEYISGGCLTDLLKHKISDRFKCKLSLDVAKGMAFLHSHNIFHRDIKPDNMLVISSYPDAHVNLKITDFGTSRASTFSAAKLNDPTYQAVDLNQKASSVSKTSSSSKDSQGGFQRRLTKGVGTLVYQAPEIIQGRVDFTIDKTDIFSFGVLLYEVFSQKAPFCEPPYDKYSKWEIEKFVGSGKRLEIPSSVPRKIRTLIERCWDQTPTTRPEFPEIVQILTEEMESLPMDSSGSVTSLPRVSASSTKSDIPIPSGNLGLVGWANDIGRSESEVKLRGCPVGTFLIRWSRNTSSYVLTYVSKGGYQHIAYIMPMADGKISVDKEDGKKAIYENLFLYVEAMKESSVITNPLTIETTHEQHYGKSNV